MKTDVFNFKNDLQFSVKQFSCLQYPKTNPRNDAWKFKFPWNMKNLTSTTFLSEGLNFLIVSSHKLTLIGRMEWERVIHN